MKNVRLRKFLELLPDDIDVVVSSVSPTGSAERLKIKGVFLSGDNIPPTMEPGATVYLTTWAPTHDQELGVIDQQHAEAVTDHRTRTHPRKAPQ